MKFTLSWLSSFVSLQGLDVAQLADKLTMLGLEVDAVEELFAELDGFVTCRVDKVEKHPDADKLTVCTVSVGEKGLFTIVCGAPNVREGLITALALPGVRLPDGTKIKKAKVRGVESSGMLCSARELGLSEDHSGIMDLDASLLPGRPLASALGLRDTMIEVDLTPNRPDCASIMGIAREVAGINHGRIQLPVKQWNPLEGRGLDYQVIIEEPELCPRYTARKVCNVSIGPSPMWMQRQLLAVGMRPINNIVDITNFVMLEMGQPLHAFDFSNIQGKKIIVRKPCETEMEFTTLDNVNRVLSPEMLMICDDKRTVAIAGVMGGLDSEVTDQTVDVLLESACFHPVSIRKTARNLNLPSEASYRFERGVDPELAPMALERAITLMEKYANATAESSGMDVYPGKKEPARLTLRVNRVCALLGIQLSQEKIAALLRDIEFDVSVDSPTTLSVTVPTFRIDVEREVDLVEEIARLVGYNEIPTSSPKITMQHPKSDKMRVLRENIVENLLTQGFYEAINYSFVSTGHLDACRLHQNDGRRKIIPVLNPLSEDQEVMRTMLLPGLLENVRRNINFQQPDIRLFEIGKTFHPQGENDLPLEQYQLCAVVSGHRYPVSNSLYFSGQSTDFYDIKGTVTSLLQFLRMTANILPPAQAKCTADIAPYCEAGLTEMISVNQGDQIGVLGQVDDQVLNNFGIKQPVYFLELNLERLNVLPMQPKQFKALPKFPSVKRDIALLVPDHVRAGEILQAISRQKQKLLESTEIFDVYQGEPVEKGLKSVALSITYRSAAKTLDDQSVDKIHGKIVQSLMTQFNARYREGT